MKKKDKVYRKAEVPWAACEENRKRPKRRSLPFKGFYLFHSRLGTRARQTEKRRRLVLLVEARQTEKRRCLRQSGKLNPTTAIPIKKACEFQMEPHAISIRFKIAVDWLLLFPFVLLIQLYEIN